MALPTLDDLERRFEYNELLGRLDEQLKSVHEYNVNFRTFLDTRFFAHEHVHELEKKRWNWHSLRLIVD